MGAKVTEKTQPQATPSQSTSQSTRGSDVNKKQPYSYRFNSDFSEPDWKRLPGYATVSQKDWEDPMWQRRHSVKTVAELKTALGSFLTDALAEDILHDQKDRSTMSMLVPPQMINTMNEKDLKNDPIRRYMVPIFSERETHWPSHPRAARDSLHEADMWVAEGLTHRYPTKVLAELLSTCPQYCGHCTRMDLVGQSVPQVAKRKFAAQQPERQKNMLEYLKKTPSVRDIVVSGGDLANVPPQVLEAFILDVLDIENIRDIRLATKGLMGLPQHYLADKTLQSFEKMAKKAHDRGVHIAVHTHINHAHSVTPLVSKAARKLLDMGFRDVRNQGVLLRGVNDSPKALLDLCFRLQDHGNILPYYFYMCDMIPNSEHWRITVARAQELQHDIMGYLPGFATPRIVCDVPFVGKRWVHQVHSYDRVKGVSYWTKNYRTSIELDSDDALSRLYEYYDPIDALPEEGQSFWEREAQR